MIFGTDWNFKDFYFDARDQNWIHFEIYGVCLLGFSGGREYGYWNLSILGFWVEWKAKRMF